MLGFFFLLAAGVQANEQYGEQFVIMFSLIMTQLKMVRSLQCNILGLSGGKSTCSTSILTDQLACTKMPQLSCDLCAYMYFCAVVGHS